MDFSGESVQAIKTGLELTNSPANIHVVHVLFPLDVMIPGATWVQVDSIDREKSARESGIKYLSEAGFSTDITFEVRIGDPGTEIAQYAKEISAELIIVPSHGFHGLKRMLLGSVAEHVIRHANAPVLVLRRSDAE
jgi:nucleotide-binding universal stress UspA family protein